MSWQRTADVKAFALAPQHRRVDFAAPGRGAKVRRRQHDRARPGERVQHESARPSLAHVRGHEPARRVGQRQILHDDGQAQAQPRQDWWRTRALRPWTSGLDSGAS